MRLRLLATSALAIAAAAQIASIRDAAACGGCFHPPTESTVVSGHRMVLSVSSVQTVLWDQIQYAGDPTDFAWVLPVRAGAYIEVGSDAWFETLDAATTVNIVAPSLDCGSGGGIGCGGATETALDEAGNTARGSDVTVLHEGTVGPYDTVTVTTDTPGALNTWLTDNGYGVDPSTQPMIDAYVAEGFDFIALKLSPDQGVQQMRPVRVITPGAAPTLPLRMVAAGTGPSVAITLFTIGEARLASGNFKAAAVPLDLVSWDFRTNESNYATLRLQALDAAGGDAFLTPYAQRGALLSPVTSPNAPFGVFYASGNSVSPVDTIAAAYVQQGLSNGETTDTQCATNFPMHAQSSLMVANPCPMGAPLSDPACGIVDSTQIDARDFACGPLDDLAIAMIGLHPKDVWVTRLEANLPQAALNTDLDLIPAARQEPVDNWIRAHVAIHPDEFCGSAIPPVIRFDGQSPTTKRMLPVWLTGIALAFAMARRLSRGRGFRTVQPVERREGV